jgi:hypothetical protein
MQRALYRLEDRLFYYGMLLPFGLQESIFTSVTIMAHIEVCVRWPLSS